MAIRLVFLGKLADIAGTPSREIEGETLDWAGLLAACEAPLAEALAGDKVRMAVNGAVLADKSALAARDGDEIALLPPVSGG